MATQMSPTLSRRLAIVVQAMDLDTRMALIEAVEAAGEARDGPGDLEYDDLPDELRRRIATAEAWRA